MVYFLGVIIAVGKAPAMGPSLDTIINLAVNAYDGGRLVGAIPTFVEIRIDSDGSYAILYDSSN